MTEIWKSIPGYEGYYEASNLGSIRSLTREKANCYSSTSTHNGRVLKHRLNKQGYRYVVLCVESKRKTHTIHKLIWLAHKTPYPKGLTIDHIDNNKENNQLDNLQLLSVRENTAKRSCAIGRTLPLGVRYHKTKKETSKKYQARIRIKDKEVSLGYFHTPSEAHEAYKAKAVSLGGYYAD